MENFKSAPTKRKLDQLEDETQFSSKKKIKAEKNNHKEGNISFSDLPPIFPPEIVHLILSFITNDTQRRHIRLVCQFWFDYINYNEFTIGLLLTSEVEQFSRCFGRYQKPIGLKFRNLNYIKDIEYGRNQTLIRSNHDFQSMLSSLTQLTALDISLKNFEVPPKLVNLQSLTVISLIHGGHTITRLTNLRRLKTSSHIACTPTTLESLDLYSNTIDSACSRLTELTFTNFYSHMVPDELSSLRKLSLFESGGLAHCSLMTLVKFPNLEEFITASGCALPTHYPSTLTKLHVRFDCLVEINEDLTQLKVLECDRVKFHQNMFLNSIEDCVVHDTAMLLERLDPQKVTRLMTKVTPENCHIFSKFTNLIDLDITLGSEIAPYSVLPSTRLTQLRLRFSNYPHQWMTQLPNVVNLVLQKSRDSTPESINFEMMHQLTSLELSGNYDSININNLTKLLHLYVNESKSYAIKIHGLSTATNLTSLFARNRNLHDSSNIAPSMELALLTNLRMLSFGKTSGADYFNIADLTTLQYLTYLEGRALNDSVWYLTRLTRLQCISLGSYEADLVDDDVILKELPFCYLYKCEQS